MSRLQENLAAMVAEGFDPTVLQGVVMETYGVLHALRCPAAGEGLQVRLTLSEVLEREYCRQCFATMTFGSTSNEVMRVETWVQKAKSLARAAELAGVEINELADFERYFEMSMGSSELPMQRAFAPWRDRIEARRGQSLESAADTVRSQHLPEVLKALSRSVEIPRMLEEPEMEGVRDELVLAVLQARRSLVNDPGWAVVRTRYHGQGYLGYLVGRFYKVSEVHDLFHVPRVALHWLRREAHGRVEEVVLTPGPVSSEALEALVVLYDPRGAGAYTTLEAALEGAEAL